MRIIAVHKGFACDHSSTSYEFLAVDKPLGKKAQGEVSKLSSRANPTGRRVSFIYHAEGYDLPGGWEELMNRHYDVMYSESYDWWTLAMAFDAPKKRREAIAQFEFFGMDDLGVSVTCKGKRVTVAVNCRMDAGALYDVGHGYEDDGYYFDEEEDDDEETFESGDGLLDLLTQVRQQLIDGDYRPLYAVWEVYGSEDEEEAPPRPPDRKQRDDVVPYFRSLLSPA